VSAERDLTVDMAAAIVAGTVYPAIFLEGEFSTGWGRWWSGVGYYDWGGHTWTGLGGLLSITPISEGTGIAARGFSVELSGQDSANISLALQACRQGKAGRLYLAAFTAAGALIADPYLLAEGRLDVAGGSDDGDSAVIPVTYESRLIDLERPREWRYTTESQRQFYPGDLGFEFVPSLQDAVDAWYPGA